MASITELLENIIIDDLQNDQVCGNFPIQSHDFAALKSDDPNFQQEEPVIIVVTAIDQGDWAGTWGAGVRNVRLEIEINVNVLATYYLGAVALDTGKAIIDVLDERISELIQPSPTVFGAVGREQDLSTFELKIYGFQDHVPTERNDLKQVRQRVIQRVVCCVKLA